jgi:hypothetical protein
VELFEEIRREHARRAGTIRAVVKKLGVHRRMVRALASVIPPERELAVRNKPRRKLFFYPYPYDSTSPSRVQVTLDQAMLLNSC